MGAWFAGVFASRGSIGKRADWQAGRPPYNVFRLSV